MNQAPIVDFTLDIARSVADQCICHPASRSVDDIERAGEAIKYLLWVIEKTRATASVMDSLIDLDRHGIADDPNRLPIQYANARTMLKAQIRTVVLAVGGE